MRDTPKCKDPYCAAGICECNTCQIDRLKRELAEAKAEINAMRGRCDNCTAKTVERERCIKCIEDEWNMLGEHPQEEHDFMPTNIVARINSARPARGEGEK